MEKIVNRFLVYAERDSKKDEAVVFIFIFSTSALLTWAALKPWVGRWIEVRINHCAPRLIQLVLSTPDSIVTFVDNFAGSKGAESIYTCFRRCNYITIAYSPVIKRSYDSVWPR